MKLVDLEATGRFDHPLVIRFSQETFEQLAPYRATREASGFVRLAVEVLLGVMDSNSESEVESIVDELVTSCETEQDLGHLAYGFWLLEKELQERIEAIHTDSPQDSLS